jgi:hypothetical protein
MRKKSTGTSKNKRTPSAFENAVKAAPAEHIQEIKSRLENAYKKSGTKSPKLLKAIENLDIEPGWFLNVNGIYRDIILDALRELNLPKEKSTLLENA